MRRAPIGQRRSKLATFATFAAALVLFSGCWYSQPDEPTSRWLATLADAPLPPPAGNNWPVPPTEAEKIFAADSLQLVDARRTVGGNTGATRAHLIADGRRIEVKWKAAPADTAEGWNNTPRREMAAFEIQKWFLRPEDYVVAPAAARCLRLGEYRAIDSEAQPTVRGTKCVIGTLSLWLENLEIAKPIYDPQRFIRDPPYAYHIANLNVLTYLVEHQDARADNFLAATDAANRRVFSIDNGITFGELRHNYLVINWDRIHVPAIPSETIAALRKVTRDDVDALASIVVLVAGPDGMMRPSSAEPPTDTAFIRFGLTPTERDELWQRIRDLLDRVDRGEILTF